MSRRAPATPAAIWLGNAGGVVIIVAGLYFGQPVLLPVALALLLAFLLTPVVTRLQRLLRSRTLAVILAVGTGVAALGGVAYVVSAQVISLAGNLPIYKDNIREKLRPLMPSEDGVFKRARQTIAELSDELGGTTETASAAIENTFATTPSLASADPAAPPAENAVTSGVQESDSEPEAKPVTVRVVGGPMESIDYITAVAGPIARPLLQFGATLVLVVFILIHRESLRDRLFRLAGRNQFHVTMHAMEDAATGVSGYLLMQLMVNLLYGFAATVGLALMGVPNSLLWGVLVAVLKFIPYIGTWIAFSMPFLVSIAISDGWGTPIAIIVYLLVLETVISSFLEPVLFGVRTGLSPVAVLLSALFWAWLWGPLGLLLSTPITVCLVVLGRYVPQLSPFPILFGDEPALPPDVRFYHRLLSLDRTEALDLADRHQQVHGAVDMFDKLLLPAVCLWETDRSAGTLGESENRSFHANVAELTEMACEGPPAPPLGDSAPRRVAVVAVSDEADGTAASMLAQLCISLGMEARVVEPGSLASEIMETIGEFQPNAVCISAVPPIPVPRINYLVRRLKKVYPEITVVAGLWQADNESATAISGGTADVALDFKDALRALA